MKKRLLALVLCCATLMAIMPMSVFASGTLNGGIEGIEKKYSESLTTDGYIGIPVDIYTYHNGNTTSDSPIALYVINTMTERIGTDSDYTIITDLINRGFIVVVLDYKNNVRAVTPALDWSVQGIRTKIDTNGSYLNGISYKKGYNYVLPAGYNIATDQLYWSFDKHGAAGTFDKIVEIWNKDFSAVKGNESITYKDGTTVKVSETTASTIYDCVRKDGTQLDLDLRMDIVYPTNPKNNVPVMTCYSSSETRIRTWTNPERPILSGFLFSGYAGAVFDYGYTPMARTDHYNYFAGDSADGITGDNYTYSLDVYSGVKQTTAAIRFLRYNADKYGFDVDNFGVYGNSKGGMATRLGVVDAANVEELRFFVGHEGESFYEAGADYSEAALNTDGLTVDNIEGGKKVTTAKGTEYIIHDPEAQPWLTYENGDEIPSNVQFVYANCGSGQDTIKEGHAPTYATGSMQDGSYNNFFPSVTSKCYTYDIPCLYFSFPNLGHAFVRDEVDRDYGVNGYQALFDMANYYLKDSGAVLEYIDYQGSNASVDTKVKLTFKFSGSVSASEIEKITVKNRVTGKVVSGSWASEFGNTSWIFIPTDLEGSQTYDINVPSNVICENGSFIKNGKKASFRTDIGTVNGALKLSDNMTASDTNGVYVLFKAEDFEASSKTAVRFTVTNDAANIIDIYALENINESDISASTGETKIGEIAIEGAGVYDVDVSEYLDGVTEGSNAAFVLRARNEAAETAIKGFSHSLNDSVDFGEKNSSDMSYDGNGTSTKLSHVVNTSYLYPLNPYISTKSRAESINIWNPFGTNTLTSDYLGKKYKYSMQIYDTDSRYVNARFILRNPDDIDNKEYIDVFKTEAGAWSEFSFTRRVTERDIQANCQVIRLYVDGRLESDNKPIYFDCITITEITTDVALSSVSLVTAPSNKSNAVSNGNGYVENGEFADTVMGGDTLLVSGRVQNPNIGKTLVGLSLNDYTGSQVYFRFNSLATDSGKLTVYGISDKTVSEGWSEATVSAKNEVYKLDIDQIFYGMPLCTIDVNGEGEYKLDITPYARYMKNIGASKATLLFVDENALDDSTVAPITITPILNGISTTVINFDDWSKVTTSNEKEDITLDKTVIGSASKTVLVDADSEIGGSGKVLKLTDAWPSIKFYGIFTENLDESDIGKKLHISFNIKNGGTDLSDAWIRYGMQSAASRMTLADGETATPDTMDYSNGKFVMDNPTHPSSGSVHYGFKDNNWHTISFEVTVTEDMLPKKIASGENVAIGLLGITGKTGPLYIDDIIITEYPKTIESYSYSQNFDDASSTGELTMNGTQGGTVIKPSGTGTTWTNFDYYKTVETENHSGTGNALMIHSGMNYNRFKLMKVFDDLSNIKAGDSYEISFFIKAEKTGYFNVGLIGDNNTTAGYKATMYPNSSVRFDIIEANKWQRVDYKVTFTQDMIDKEISCLVINPAGFGQGPERLVYSQATDLAGKEYTVASRDDSGNNSVNLYIDDIYSAKVLNSGNTLPISDKVDGTSDGSVVGIKKTYLSYSSITGDIQKAILKLEVLSNGTQVIKVYGIPSALTSSLTWNNAPENTDSTAMSENATLIATITLNGAGVYTVDVTEFVLSNSAESYVFAVTSDDVASSETSYIEIDKNSTLVIDTAKELCNHDSSGDTDNMCSCGIERPLAFLKPTHIRLGLYDEISMSFRVPAENLVGFSAPVLKISFNGNSYELNAEISDDGSYIFTTPRISPQLAGETITYTLWANNGTSDVYGASYTVSIMDYCYAALASANISGIEKNLIADTLNYCAAAQTWLNSSTALVNAGLSAYPQYGTNSEPSIESTGMTNNGDNITAISIGLSNGLRIRVTEPGGLKLVVKDSSGIIATIDEFYADNGSYVAYFNGSSASQLRKLYTFELVDGNGNAVQTITNYSFETYAYGVILDEKNEYSDSLKALVKAMMNYGDSAYIYCCDSAATAEVVLKDGARGTVALVLDDGDEQAADYAAGYLQKYTDTAASFALITKNYATLSKDENGYIMSDDGKYTFTQNTTQESATQYWKDYLQKTDSTGNTIGSRVELISHSHTHALPSDGDYYAELLGSRHILEALFGYDSAALITPGGFTKPEGYYAAKDEIYLSGRGTDASLNPASMVCNLSSFDIARRSRLSSFMVQYNNLWLNGEGQFSDATISAEDALNIINGEVDISHVKNFINSAMESGGLAAFCIHGIVPTTYNNGTNTSGLHIYDKQADAIFAYVQQYAETGELWSATYSEAVKYYCEWNTSRLDTRKLSNNSMVISLTDSEDTELCDIRLTVKISVDDSWNSAVLTQGDYSETLEIKGENGAKYVLANILPNAGLARLKAE